MESTSYVSHSEYTTSWLRTFLSVADQFRAMNNSLDTEDEFVSLLRKEVSEYLNDDSNYNIIIFKFEIMIDIYVSFNSGCFLKMNFTWM